MRKALTISRTQLITALVIVLAAWFGLSDRDTSEVMSLLESRQPGLYSVSNVVDGDTIEISMNGQVERVRMIGVDTPEKNHPQKPVQCFAEAASQHLASAIGAQPVRLENDPTNQNRDRYNRLLRYVYLPDGTLLNAVQIAEGYGFAYTAFPFTKMAEFIELEARARTGNKGLWDSCRVTTSDGYVNTEPAN